jgi:hypothetical protein
VELFFSILQRQCLRDASFRSIEELHTAVLGSSPPGIGTGPTRSGGPSRGIRCKLGPRSHPRRPREGGP